MNSMLTKDWSSYQTMPQEWEEYFNRKLVWLKGKNGNYTYQIPYLNKFYETMNEKEFEDDDLDEFDEDIDDD